VKNGINVHLNSKNRNFLEDLHNNRPTTDDSELGQHYRKLCHRKMAA